MKPVLDFLPKNSDESFVTKFFDYHYYPTPWHFHPEFELVLVTESTGKRFIGDQITGFGPGDMALIGPNLPHLYRNDPEYYLHDSALRAKSIVVHFNKESFGADFLDLPESKAIQSLFQRSAKGLQVTGKTNEVASKMLRELLILKGLSKWLKLLEILHLLSESQEINNITTNSIIGENTFESGRMDQILDFVYQNFPGKISIAEIAGKVNMAENSFSRYFSQRTRQSFTSFLNEVRLGYAAKLLMETHQSVISVSLECGFCNLSNFNRQFKGLYKQSPLNFRKHYHRPRF
jgi:AraC-like DNA-binding protein